MGRAKRIQFSGACYLISLSGNNRQNLFLTNYDRRHFLSLLKAHKERYGLTIYAYCLMDNHLELLLETSTPNLSVVMQGFGTQYTKYFNSSHNTLGHVFQGRYKAWIVDKETHLTDMTGYVHLTPVRDGLKEKPWRYQWSSCAAYVEAESKEPMVDTHAVLRQFGHSRLKQSVRYLNYIQSKVSTAGHDQPPIVGGIAIGGQKFLEDLQRAYHNAEPAKRAVPEEAARAIIARICAKKGIPEDKLMSRVQWREITSVRQELIYAVWRETKMTVSELARFFGRTPSSISQIIRLFEDNRVKNK